MRNELSKNSKIILIIFYFLIGVIFLLLTPKDISDDLYVKYYFVLFSYFLIFGYWIINIFKHGFYLFEPVTMVSILTIITYSIEPLLSMLNDDTDIAGFYVYNGCIKATCIYMMAMVLFLFVYYHKFTGRGRYYKNRRHYEENEENCVASIDQNNNKLLIYMYFFAILGTAVLLLDTVQSGYSLSYIFSWGSKGTTMESESGLGALINLRYVSAAAFIYLDEYDKRKWPVWTMRIIMIFALLVRTTRWFLIVLIISPIVYKYVKSMKKIKYKYIIVMGMLVAVMIGIMQFARVQVRDGAGITAADWSSFSFKTIWEAFSGNFDLYKTLYGAVTYFPSKHWYTMGQQLIYLTLVTCIPRSIWPGKPTSIIDGELKAHFLGNGAVRGHWAYAQLTEYYIEFGIIGVIICIVIFAKFCKYLKGLYEERNSIHDLVLYSVMFPMLMQLVIRGYMPINFWAMVFMWLPVFVLKRIK